MRHITPTWSMDLSNGRVAHMVATDRSHGDFATGSEDPVDRNRLESVRRSIVDAPWSWLNQLHGDGVFVVESIGDHAGEGGDALCTRLVRAPIAVQVADCAPVALFSTSGVIGVAHAGWRGLVAGVLGATIAAMRGMGASDVVAVLGPCIHPESYRFGDREIEVVERVLGPGVRAVTSEGSTALDVPACVRAALAQDEVPLIAQLGGCTANESAMYWSHRARADLERQAVVCWMEDQ